jgi:trehalose transport system substrate-binding protein
MRWIVALIGILALVLTDIAHSAEPTITLTMRLAEAEWQVVRQEVLPPFEAACGCRVQAIDIPPEALRQRLQAMQRAGRMHIDVFAQDNMRLQELVDAHLVAPLTPDEAPLDDAIYPSLRPAGVIGGTRYFLPFRPNVRYCQPMPMSSIWNTAISTRQRQAA